MAGSREGVTKKVGFELGLEEQGAAPDRVRSAK